MSFMTSRWKTKAERLRLTILSAGHQNAKPLQPGVATIIEMFREAARTGDASGLGVALDRVPQDDVRPLWEPMQTNGWRLQATMYLLDAELWWLVHAERMTSSQSPSEKEIALLENVLRVLGCAPDRDTIIGPRSSPEGHPALIFGWWTWRNVAPLYEIQVHPKKHGAAALRFVRLGTPPSDGYETIDLTTKSS